MRTPRIAIVDSGVHADHPHVGGVCGGVGVGPDGHVTTDIVDVVGHGTAVAAVVREKAPDADIYVVKIFDRVLSTSIEALCRGIELAADVSVDVINLSLGTTNEAHVDRLSAAVAYASARGALVVSPAEHQGVRWRPGSLPGVVGVTLDWSIPRESCRVERASDASLVVSASGYPRPIPGVPPERNLKGISFASANVSGLLAVCARDDDWRPDVVSVAAKLTSIGG
ncbi:MAG: S8 family serine peptidase [Vicinamibacterales bacterium]